MDISENGRKIGEKLYVLLDDIQRKELTKYVLEWKNHSSIAVHPIGVIPQAPIRQTVGSSSLTEIQIDDLYFCLEERKVLVRGREIPLTAREFNAFQLLITNRRHVMTFEMITDHIWGYDYDSVENMLGAIHNIMSRIKQKLRVEPDIPEYVSSVRGVGYKFNK